MTPKIRSRIMARVKSKGNRSTELRLIRLFRENGVVGWRRGARMEGMPDFVFPRKRVAVFVDGCFWHGCALHCRMPSSKRAYWLAKIARNMARDKETSRSLRRKGWLVVRLWEHDLTDAKKSRKIAELKAIGRREKRRKAVKL